MLKRTYARICLVLAGLCIALLISSAVFFTHPTIPIVFVCIAIGLFVAAIIVKVALLRCPSCGNTNTPLQWSKSNTAHCSKCGKPFIYDR